jgi:hypothetical protein
MNEKNLIDRFFTNERKAPRMTTPITILNIDSPIMVRVGKNTSA